MSNDDICYLPQPQALALFKSRKLSPLELMKALIERAERVNPKVNCFADRYVDEALGAGQALRSALHEAWCPDRPARGHSAGGEGCATRQGQADDARLADLQGLCSTIIPTR